MRAEHLAHSDDELPAMRRFYRSFSKAQHARSGKANIFAAVRQTILNVDLLEEFNSLKELAQQRDPGLIQHLEVQGFQTSKGVGYQSLVNNYLAERLQITNIALQNACQTALGVHGLVQEFGRGIIVILPSTSMNK